MKTKLNTMYLTSKNGHFGAVIYSLSDVIKYHNEGFIVYQPIFTDYGSLTIPTQSKTKKLFDSNKLLEMEFRNNVPYWNNKPLTKTVADDYY
jgi:hypothetical protein